MEYVNERYVEFVEMSYRERCDVMKSLRAKYNQLDCEILEWEDEEFLKLVFQGLYDGYDLVSKLSLAQIKYIKYLRNPAYPNSKCFFIQSTDDVLYPIGSKPMCGCKKSPLNRLNEALRFVIQPQIIKFKNENPKPDEDGIYEIDHIIEFNQLRDDWMKSIGKTRKNANEMVFVNDMFRYELKEEYYASWYDYHNRYCKLRWLLRTENQLLGIKNECERRRMRRHSK